MDTLIRFWDRIEPLTTTKRSYSVVVRGSVQAKKMLESESCCVSGPPDDYPSLNGSLGKFLFDALKRRGADDIVNIDAITENVLTCQELLEESVTAAGVLKHLQIQRGDIIAIISENTIHYCAPVLAALYVGATVNPLNPGYAIGELKHTLAISKPKLILCSESALRNILKVKKELEFPTTIVLMGPGSETHTEIISYESLLKTITPDVDNFEPETFDCSEQGAFIFLSSGTTGLPKGVLLTHNNCRASLGYLQSIKYGDISARETTVLVLPLFHIFGLLIQVAAIAFSMKLILLEKFKPNMFLDSIQKHKITKLFVVPPLLLFLVGSPLVDSSNMSSLRDILVGAAPVAKPLQQAAAERFSGVTIRQIYGATETGGACTFQKFGADKPGSAGTLVPGITAMVWDSDHKKKLGPLETGELCFKGPMIMKRYVNNTASTEDSIDGEYFYHTGDLGYYDYDGYFYIVDRMKELIKYKGFQVPPAELEALILSHPGVKDCGVIGIPDERAGQVPLAYVVRENGTNITEENVVEYVADRISAQKRLYGGVVFVEDIPKNASGKILRRKLMDVFISTCENDNIVHRNGLSK